MTNNPYRYPYVPIGGIIEWDGTGLTGAPDLSTPEKVAAVYGYGTWERYGTDRVTVGAGGDYAAGSVGGEKEHTLTVDEMPSHSHRIHNMSWGGKDLNSEIGNEYNFWVFDENNNAAIGIVYLQAAGSDNPHNNMQPYIAPYRYRRIT
nr:MAG TPA: baseplate protein [Caudoviricetes sp.]